MTKIKHAARRVKNVSQVYASYVDHFEAVPSPDYENKAKSFSSCFILFEGIA